MSFPPTGLVANQIHLQFGRNPKPITSCKGLKPEDSKTVFRYDGLNNLSNGMRKHDVYSVSQTLKYFLLKQCIHPDILKRLLNSQQINT